MKRKELIKRLSGLGCILMRRGGRHDLFKNPSTGKQQPVPRHTEIDEHLAKHIIKELS
ncbi:MAG: type II toxin-antitoxin system HicA family toxin [Candidatus Edwardsbacteria bacterium]|nr:type II toxin-antitoxin system HicA family toxin [Candidatus Edwardsbacteria bacterium]MBU1575577.1 type II toxin-antitoxin system HicA family toxin [Candidatus Edwardsbacteria bacterium]MBU2463599.1 type II toxin-antitoxin system HicA family toxin [Candidatus Edwardsbacteria bacterium]MBU2593842.1 type II toxin-antitoxin system HicA family toxin [Candidatus Edwardsbacteria bacterium]